MNQEDTMVVEDWIVRDRIKKGDRPNSWGAVYERLCKFAGYKVATSEEVRLYLKDLGFETTNTQNYKFINLSFQRIRPTRYKQPRNDRCEHCGRFYRKGGQSK